MNQEYVKSIASKQCLTIEEVEFLLNEIVKYMRESLDINDSDTRLCLETSMSLSNVCNNLKIPYIPLSTNILGMPELEHHFGITGFNTVEGQVCFILDLTYIQFSRNEYPMLIGRNVEPVPSPGTFISLENKEKIIKNGYLTLTEENLNDYIRGFIETYKFGYNVNEDKVYNELYKIFNEYNINAVEYDYLNKDSGFNI